jgi:mitogen-activated protein kinase 1/3
MLSGKPLFPGRDCTYFISSVVARVRMLIYLNTDHDQLSIILDILGTPSIDDFYAITSQRSREYIRALPFRKKKNLQTLFPGASALVSFVRSFVRSFGCFRPLPDLTNF